MKMLKNIFRAKTRGCFGEKDVLVPFGAPLGSVDTENWGRFWAKEGR